MDTRNTTPVRQDVRELTADEINAVAGGDSNGIGNTIQQAHTAAHSFILGNGGNGGNGGLGAFGGTGGAGGAGGSGY